MWQSDCPRGATTPGRGLAIVLGMSSDVAVCTPAPRVGGRYGPVGLASAAVFTAGAGAVHLAVVPDHLAEYLPFGAFFVVVGLGQLAASVALLWRPSRRLLGLIAAGAAALVGLWAVSRTTGLPVGPEGAWEPEQVGVPDVVCVALEVAAVVVLVGLVRRGARPRRRRPVRTPLAIAPVLLMTAVAAFVGVGTGLSGMPVAFSAAPPTADHPGATPVTALIAAPGREPVRDFVLTARPGRVDGHPAETFDGTVPGPELRVTQGDRVRVTLVNRLQVATTLHWHGLRVPNADDGVAGLTQDAVAPGASFTYEFVATDAGTYWYHSHQNTGNQIAAGLFGALIVEPPGGRTAEAEDKAVLLHNAVDGSNTVRLNGATGDVHLDARPAQTVRLRLIDAVVPGMDGTAQAPVLLGAPYRVAALDGHDLNGDQQLGPQRLELGMGQRADLVFTMPASGEVRLVDSAVAGSPSALQGAFGSPATPAASMTLGTGPPPPSMDPQSLPLFDALSYGTPAPDPTTGPPDLTAPVVLGEHPGFHNGAIQLVHTINQAAAPQTPPIVVRAGQLVRLQFVNTTDEIHPMHLHGHVFSVLDVDGRRTDGSPLHLDTVLVGPRQTVDVAFRADNPGLWMLHCHVPLHAAMGMSTTVDYVGVDTPFTMGNQSGNFPE